MKISLISFLLIALISGCDMVRVYNEATTLTTVSPESVGMSSERISRIDSMCADAVAREKVPGIVALVARNGKVVLHEAYGSMDAASGKEMQKDAIFRIASQTKAITATAVMMLWEEGLFRLDDPISKYVPEFKDPGVLESFNPADSSFTATPAGKEITIRQLLTHTSGLGYGMIDTDEFRKIYQKAGIVDAWTTSDYTIKENTKKLAGLPLHHIPGERFTYSLGLDVLGYFIEIMSGMPFDEFLETRLFGPLGMEDTHFYLPGEKAGRLVSVVSREDGNWIPHTSPYYDPDFPVRGAKAYFSGGGGLLSTSMDYARFLQMYLNGGELDGVRVLSPVTVRVILSNQIGDLWGESGDAAFGLAFQLVTEAGQAKGGQGSAGTFSWGGYFNTSYFADPQENVIGILMKQTYGAPEDDTDWKFRLLAFQALAELN